MTHILMALPFEESALEPSISQETMAYHHGKHHAGYVDKLNALIQGTPYKEMELEEIIKTADGDIFNNAAQVYNHNFYFKGMSHKKSTYTTNLEHLIHQDFGSLEALKEAFLKTAAALFGSGWVWLSVDKAEKLIIETFSNAQNPLLTGNTPLLTCDVWEHAYYIDHRNARADYLEKWWSLINWEYVAQNLTTHVELKYNFIDPCNDNSELCEYIDTLNQTDHVNT